MAGDVIQRSTGGGKKGLRRPKRRLSIRIDMTPMVDIAFLLLIFYMVSTVFSQPQAMEINLPDPEEQETEIEVKESNLLTIWVDGDNTAFWLVGKPTGKKLPQPFARDIHAPDSLGFIIDSDSLIKVLYNKNFENTSLNTLILIHPKANFSSMIELLDDIDLLERSINSKLAEKLGKRTSELTNRDGKFSYRYAMDKWEVGGKVDNIIRAARRKAFGE
jgi:biopolymer transport protein ExbD